VARAAPISCKDSAPPFFAQKKLQSRHRLFSPQTNPNRSSRRAVVVRADGATAVKVRRGAETPPGRWAGARKTLKIDFFWCACERAAAADERTDELTLSPLSLKGSKLIIPPNQNNT
jgi:hypothetical protein